MIDISFMIGKGSLVLTLHISFNKYCKFILWWKWICQFWVIYQMKKICSALSWLPFIGLLNSFVWKIYNKGQWLNRETTNPLNNMHLFSLLVYLARLGVFNFGLSFLLMRLHVSQMQSCCQQCLQEISHWSFLMWKNF